MTPVGLQTLARTKPERALRLGILWLGRLPMTQAEIAECLGVSRAQVWKLEQSAVRKIRTAMEATR